MNFGAISLKLSDNPALLWFATRGAFISIINSVIAIAITASLKKAAAQFAVWYLLFQSSKYRKCFLKSAITKNSFNYNIMIHFLMPRLFPSQH